MSDEIKIIGLTIREFRLKKGWTQEALANASGLHPSYIGSVERGHRNLGLLNLFKIARALSVHPTDLFARIER
ncbi:helix-turn-helix transcriptional regulator [Synechococcus sp. FACHB-909]|uniref:helix-turn-helix domain-containing protein n=1 Tax=Synechococcus sp. FACHB-909 TaxID=2692863 RepID=UPI00168414E0|nr:helix-turn-helix transcriptional regulator [Synechococcus sp. FACHB-909]MBD2720141.1 helix-turn-helix transcriptional regulator [Synechococcus sp. FACHB-909]